jgi:hypothetical protein
MVMTEEDRGKYREAVRSAVRTLSHTVGAALNAMTTSDRDVAALIDEMFEQKQKPEYTAVRIVADVMSGEIARSFTAEQKKEIIAELSKLTQMSLEAAQSHMTYSLVRDLASAWVVCRRWADEGKIDEEAGKFLMGCIVRALASGPR